MNRTAYIPLVFALLCALAVPAFVRAAEQDDPPETGPDQAQQRKLDARLDQITAELKRMQGDMRRLDERIGRIQSQAAKPPAPPKPKPPKPEAAAPTPPRRPGPMMMGGRMQMGMGQGMGAMPKQMQQRMEEMCKKMMKEHMETMCNKMIKEHVEWMRAEHRGGPVRAEHHAYGEEHHGERMHAEHHGYRARHEECDECGGMMHRRAGEKGREGHVLLDQMLHRFEGRIERLREESRDRNPREVAEHFSHTLREQADRIDHFLHEEHAERGAEYHGMKAERRPHHDPDED